MSTHISLSSEENDAIFNMGSSSRLVTAASFVMAFVVASAFVLPNTIFSLVRYAIFDASRGGVIQSLFGALCVGIAWLSYIKYLRPRSSYSYLLWVSLLAYLMVVVLSCFEGDSALTAACDRIITSLAFGLIASRLCSTTKRTFLLLMILGFIQAIYSLTGFLNGHLVMFSGSIARAAGTFHQPNSLYTEMLFCLFPSIYWMIKSRKQFLPLLLSTLISSCMMCALVMTWSRGAMIALAVGMFYFLIPLVRRSWVRLTALAACLVVLVLSSFAHRAKTERDSELATRASVSRIHYLNENISLIENHFAFGVGVRRDFVTSRKGNIVENTFFSKNVMLSMTTEFGIFGFLIFVALSVGIKKTASNVKNLLLRRMLLAVWLAIFVAALVDVPFLAWTRPEGNTLLAMLLGATMAATE